MRPILCPGPTVSENTRVLIKGQRAATATVILPIIGTA
jgi:hypothetical protein